MFLLDDILLAPVKGVKWVAERLQELADKELFDPEKIREELMTLQARLDMGEIGEEEYGLREREILRRMEDIRKGESHDRNP